MADGWTAAQRCMLGKRGATCRRRTVNCLEMKQGVLTGAWLEALGFHSGRGNEMKRECNKLLYSRYSEGS